MTPALAVADHLALIELYARYTHAFDEGSAEDLAALFLDDGEFTRPGADPVRGRSALVDMVKASSARGSGTRHLVSAVAVTSTGRDEASGRAYVQVVGITDTIRPVVMGRYDDTFVRADGRWRIRSRHFTPFPAAPSRAP